MEERARHEVVERPLGLIEELLTVCSTPRGAIQGGNKLDAPAKRGRKRSKGKGAKATNAAKEARGGGGGGHGSDKTDSVDGNAGDEVVVLRAYALEAGVGLCCLLPADDQSETAGRKKTLERLLRWHER